jgi:hypothetical protein
MIEDQNRETEQDGNIEYSKEELNENISQQETIAPTETIYQTTDIITSDIQNMEVHHHPHVETKSFKEYLLEGLMIFVAVTLGFFSFSAMSLPQLCV